jgi:hypothetical protein
VNVGDRASVLHADPHPLAKQARETMCVPRRVEMPFPLHKFARFTGPRFNVII